LVSNNPRVERIPSAKFIALQEVRNAAKIYAATALQILT
jgi:hypothetical protein